MATGKQRGKRPTLTVKTGDSKSRVEEMFGGTKQPDEPNPQPVIEVAAVIPLPEHADPDPENPSAKDIKDRVTAIFNSIGTADMTGTEYPRGRDNKGPVAAEFVVAQQLKKLAEARYEKAKAEASDTGCFGDPEAYVSGETVEVYRGPAYTFSVQRNRDSEVVDKERTEQVLREVAPNKWQELLKRCKKPRAGATQIVVALR
jgi:hypothetical protein